MPVTFTTQPPTTTNSSSGNNDRGGTTEKGSQRSPVTSPRSGTYTATDSTNRPGAHYHINYSVGQWAGRGGKTATVVGPVVPPKTTVDGVGERKNDSQSHHNNNVNCLPCAPSGRRTETISPPAAGPTTTTTTTIPTINMARHDNRNNNNQSAPIGGAPEVDGIDVPVEECNRINNNHLVEGAIAPPSSLASRTSSHRTSASSAVFDDELVATENDISTHTTTSDTVDQRLPVYV
ncbi:hypothetical protein ZHAS_00014129 [Anopheles sinensis]|uniref:Uncharacterized protein n=1 Tax=Anopheles sinensis TaxID=74873 RepID=A0A084W7P7_ANOSI|nr:hypothetical protein ZHAS_00014129 [Anopheles sinensis]